MINIGHRVYNAALIAPGEKAASTACYLCAEQQLGVGVGVADAHEPPAIRSSHIIAASGGGVVFLFFFIPVLNLGGV